MSITSPHSSPQLVHFNSMNTQWSPTSPQQQNYVKQFSRRHRTIPRTRSTLSAVDSKFVELTRCLYQAKTIVQDLSSFHTSVLPTLSLSTYHDPTQSPQQKVGSAAFLQHIKQYLDDNFMKFTKLCKLLMMILSRLEQNVQVKPERVHSFRNEIMEEWRVASEIKRHIQSYLQQNNHLFDGSNGPATSQWDFLHAASSPPSIRQQEMGSESPYSL